MPAEPLASSDFQLDLSGVAGFFGGDVAVRAMSTVHVYKGRKWLGWYNMPGSYEIAKNYGQLCRSRFWDGIYPGDNVDPAEFFKLDGQDGPEYRGIHSGTRLTKTGHIAHLLVKHCKDLKDPVRVLGRREPTIQVTIVQLSNDNEPKESPRIIRKYSSILAAVPILSTLATAIACAVFSDWYSFAMIMLGCVSSGLSCLVLGTGTLKYSRPKASAGSPPGDGILDGGSGMIVLLGPENAVNAVTKGAFSLGFSSEPEYNNIGWCSVLLTVQFVVQLLLVPQGRLFGQIMFLASLFVSWGYNMYLCSIDTELAQREIMMQSILYNPPMEKFLLPTRTATVVLVLLFLAGCSDREVHEEVVQQLLDDLLPNTLIWKIWKSYVVPKIASAKTSQDWSACCVTDQIDINWQSIQADLAQRDEHLAEGLANLQDKDRSLLKDLLTDAKSAYNAYQQHPLPQSASSSPETASTSSVSTRKRSFLSRVKRVKSPSSDDMEAQADKKA